MGKTQTSVSNGLCTREPRITQTILHPDIPIGTPTHALRTLCRLFLLFRHYQSRLFCFLWKDLVRFRNPKWNPSGLLAFFYWKKKQSAPKILIEICNFCPGKTTSDPYYDFMIAVKFRVEKKGRLIPGIGANLSFLDSRKKFTTDAFCLLLIKG